MKRQALISTTIALWIFGVAVAHATITFELKGDPQADEQKIVFGLRGPTISGATDKSNTEVTFSSTVDTLLARFGRSELLSRSGVMHDVTVTVPGHTFQDFIVDLMTRADNSVISVLVTEGDGTTDPFQFTGGIGSNFVTVIASAGETIFSVDYSSTSGWVQFKEPRVSGISGVSVVPSEAFLVPSGVVVVPEPSTWAMMALGFAGLGLVGYRKTRSDNALA